MDINELFEQEESRMAAEYEADKASGSIDREANVRAAKFQAEIERLERNGCIIRGCENEEGEEEEDWYSGDDL